jgi:uncharacterized lipoprotein YmbA
MKNFLNAAILATFAVVGLSGCASDEPREDTTQAPTAGAADSMSTAPAPQAEVSAVETTPEPAPVAPTEEYERMNRK